MNLLSGSRERERVGLGRIVHSLTLAATVFLSLGFASLTHAADDNKILYPSNSAPASAPATGGLGHVTLVVGLVLAAAGGWFVWRGRTNPARAADGRVLAIEETRSLGNRQFLVVASYQEKKFLLGVCQGRIDLLAPLHDEKPRT
ncbi:MAG: flagellar biosynthetic protein FliO [Verrucomicrobia bacterium]|nr:flagellar biosynthetic protein FliO [Verrucomicrobiota bacterium]